MKSILGFNNYYIEENGDVYSDKTGKLVKLKPFLDSQKKYWMIRIINNDGIRKTKLIHRLVAEAYIPNPKNLPEVNHKDKNTQNPNKNNLEWCTRKDNLYDSYKTLSQKRNFKKCNLYYNNEFVENFDSLIDAAKFAKEKYNINYESLLKYKECGKCYIETSGNNIKYTNKKQYNKNKVFLYKDEKYIGEFKSVTKAYQYIKLNYGIEIKKIKGTPNYKIKGFYIKRNNLECNDYPI